MRLMGAALLLVFVSALAGCGTGEDAIGGMAGAPPAVTVKHQQTPEPELKRQVLLEADNPKRSETYTVQKGDTLWSIARRFDLSVETLVAVNGLQDPDRIPVGRVLKIPPADGQYYRIRAGDTLWSISQRYGLEIEKVIELNGITNPGSIHPGELIFLPGHETGKDPEPKDAIVASSTREISFTWPVEGRVTSPYGQRWGRNHTGIDVAAPAGTPIKAAAAGVVRKAGWIGGYGRTVVIDHGDGTQTLYAHASSLTVSRGQRVEQGDTIARVGSTGNSTGPHLHFEVIIKGNPTNPVLHLP